jgi:hypothetical protein
MVFKAFFIKLKKFRTNLYCTKKLYIIVHCGLIREAYLNEKKTVTTNDNTVAIKQGCLHQNEELINFKDEFANKNFGQLNSFSLRIPIQNWKENT